MSFARKAAKNGLWFAGFRLLIQSFSWIVTIVIARILSPADYGLMAMASILSGYVEIFSELGLGAAIVQKREINHWELSSVFWLCIIMGSLFSLVIFFLAYPTAWIFKEPRVIPLTQMISVSFILGSVMIVPYNMMTRDVRFKEIGIIQLSAVIVQSFSMLLLAYWGFGVWTLVIGTIMQRAINVVMTFRASKWRPALHFHFAEAKSFLKFGLNVAGARTFFYLFQKSDKFIVGKLFNVQLLGFYSFAMQLASIPTDKIIAIIYQVSFPVFSRYQNNIEKCTEMYLKTTKYVALIVAPLFVAGFFGGAQIVTAFLGDKWLPIVPLFKMFCISQFIISLTVINNVLNNAQGRAQWTMFYHLVNALLLPLSLLVASKYGFNALIIPWISVFPVTSFLWTWATIRKLHIPITRYMKCILGPLVTTFMIIIAIWITQLLFTKLQISSDNYKIVLIENVLIGSAMYVMYILLGEKKTLNEVLSLKRSPS